MVALTVVGSQRHPGHAALTGTATGYVETLTATGALDVNVPVSIIEVLGTATTVASPYTLGTGSYDGQEKWIVTAQTATDGVGVSKITLSNPVGDPAAEVLALEFPAAAHCLYVNDRWICFGSLAVGLAPLMATA